jgi:predicted dehydrogenase
MDKTIESSFSAVEATGQPLRIGIIGFGHLAQNYYVPALRKMGLQLEIYVADPLESSRIAAASAFPDARTYADYQQMLETEDLQALLVATPPSKHLDIWQAARQRGLAVFMEKPFLLASELEQIDTADPAWQKLMINFNRRFWPAYQSLGQRVADGSLGRVTGARFVLEVNTKQWSQVSNHRAGQCEGGALYDLGSHVLDLVWITFRRLPTEILAQRSGNGALDERIKLTLRFSDGLIVDCLLGYGSRNRESVSIKGEKASLRMRDPNCLCWLERNPQLPTRLARTAVDLAVLGYRGLHRGQSMLRYTVSASLGAFLETLGTGRPFVPGFEDALRVAQYAGAAAASMTTERNNLEL